MLNIISNIPSQFKIGYHAAKIKLKQKNINRIIICGMGGSALAGDILKMWAENKETEKQRNRRTEKQKNREIEMPKIIIHKDYNLPQNIDTKNSLVICVSYSGNTEETISSYQIAVKNKIPTIIITNDGGKLLALSKKYKTPIITINIKNIPPRLSLASQFSALLGILKNLLPEFNQKINFDKQIKNLSKIKITAKQKKYAETLANKLKNKIPLIYSSNQSSALAYNLKINLNETSKSPAFYNVLPEMNHNEIVGFDKKSFANKKIFAGILIKSNDDCPKIIKQMYIIKKLLPKIKFYEMKTGSNKNLTDIFNTIIFSNCISYYLAKNYKIDPIKTDIIEKLKNEMAK